MIAATIVNAGALSGGGSPPSAPTASFRLSDANPILGETVQLTDTSSGNPTTWAWYVNGALFSNMWNPTFYCASYGTFVITLTASNAFGSNTTSPGSNITVGGGQP